MDKLKLFKEMIDKSSNIVFLEELVSQLKAIYLILGLKMVCIRLKIILLILQRLC